MIGQRCELGASGFAKRAGEHGDGTCACGAGRVQIVQRIPHQCDTSDGETMHCSKGADHAGIGL